MRLVGWMTPYVGGHYGQCPLYQSPISRYPPVNTSPFVLFFLSFYLFILLHSPGRTYDQPPGHNFLSANSASKKAKVNYWACITRSINATMNFSGSKSLKKKLLLWIPYDCLSYLSWSIFHVIWLLIWFELGATLLSNALKFVERRWSEISNLAYY